MTWQRAQQFFQGATIGAGAALLISLAVGHCSAWMFFWLGIWAGLSIGTRIVRWMRGT